MNPVFLSASEPDPTRKPEYWETRHLLNVREAVRALTAYVLPRAPLVFGGHPTITPLVEAIADRVHHDATRPRYDDQGRVERSEQPPPIVLRFLSSHFANRFSNEPDALRNTIVTPAANDDGAIVPPNAGSRAMSLLLMRYAMIGRAAGGPCVERLARHRNTFGAARKQRLGTDEFTAGIFIGGMEGVVREFTIFRHFHPTTPAWPIASTGSACRELLGALQLPAPHDRMLREETAYDLLMEQLFATPKPYRAAPPPPFREQDHFDPPNIK